MIRNQTPIGTTLIVFLSLAAISTQLRTGINLPEFGRDTVLVWKVQNQSDTNTFVVRIAEFLPNRYIEWENATTQGTILMTRDAVSDAEDFIGSRLFEAGKENRVDNKMTIWLSRRIFDGLQADDRIKVKIDSVAGQMEVIGRGAMAVLVNRSSQNLPVIKISDNRGAERWFLDSAENPIMVKYVIRNYTQILSSITTNKTNTLRWIKGKKLNTPDP